MEYCRIQPPTLHSEHSITPLLHYSRPASPLPPGRALLRAPASSFVFLPSAVRGWPGPWPRPLFQVRLCVVRKSSNDSATATEFSPGAVPFRPLARRRRAAPRAVAPAGRRPRETTCPSSAVQDRGPNPFAPTPWRARPFVPPRRPASPKTEYGRESGPAQGPEVEGRMERVEFQVEIRHRPTDLLLHRETRAVPRFWTL